MIEIKFCLLIKNELYLKGINGQGIKFRALNRILKPRFLTIFLKFQPVT